jgi:ProP effector
MSIENDSAPAAPADHAEMPQEATAPLAKAHDAAPAETGSVTQPTQASPEAATAPAAEEPAEQVAGAVSEEAAVENHEPVASGAEEGAAPAPAKNDLSPAQCAARLAEMFPALFGMEGPPKPIKLRIQADIQERAPGLFTRKALSIVLHRHTTTTPYLKALLAAPSRFDLDGQPAGDIAEEHRQAAREEVERRRAIVAARRAAEGQARNPREPRGPRPPRAQVPGGSLADGTPGETGQPGSPEAATQPGTPAPMAPARRDRGPREGSGTPGGRPPRKPQDFREPRGGREAGEAREPRESRDPREARPPRSTWPAGNRPGRHGAGPASASQRDARPPRPDARFGAARDTANLRPQPEAQAHSTLPEDPARRERALLLRTYEASSLTKANFCVLKRITEAELDAQLEQARQERGPARPRA